PMKNNHASKPLHPVPGPCELRWGALSLSQFLANYWQQQALVLRGFVAQESVNTPLDALIARAADADVASRLIRCQDDRWTMQHGPFDRLPGLSKKHWTVLLQGMDRCMGQAYRLREAFCFLPHARIDDVMVSVASPGGGVGAHLDAYDVFLIQGLGLRRWRWGYQREQSFQADRPLKLLNHFKPQYEAVLEPGDALYLPPNWAHEGTALSACSTWSVGFRAPSRHEFLAQFLLEASESVAGPNPRYQDRSLRATRKPGRIPAELRNQLRQWALDFRSDTKTFERALGRFLSEPAPNAWFQVPKSTLSFDRWLSLARKRGLALHPASRMVYDRHAVWFNGELAGKPQPLLCALADARRVDPQKMQTLSEKKMQALSEEHSTTTLSNAPISSDNTPSRDGVASECKKTVEFQPLFEGLFAWYRQGWIVISGAEDS
ncbi:MAG: hypothetical protein EB114_02825, partial [Betaproteobacteria bacterium]|nr:hypothetical protein [Betaproteobacteria bacterium]